MILLSKAYIAKFPNLFCFIVIISFKHNAVLLNNIYAFELL